MSLFAYNLFLHTVAAPVIAACYLPQILLKGKYRNSLMGKLGRLSSDFPERLSRPRLWFHAVSVGEVVALAPVIKAVKELVPLASVIVSTGTETGQQKAREQILEADAFLYLPLDFPGFLKPVVSRIMPDLFVLMETELWPNLISTLDAGGAAIALANGRISDRSFPRYKRLKGFFSSTLEKIDLFLMSSEIDGLRIAEMGATQDRVRVTGNTKFDAALAKLPSDTENEIAGVLGLDGSDMVLVAGSVHPGEYKIILDAYNLLVKQFQELKLIIVPRHIERTPQVLAAMKDRNMELPFLRSSADEGATRDGRSVIIVDRIGELFQIFSLASVVFMGGSLVPRGGQNILEPAAWGKVVLFGPSTQDFRDARDLLIASGAGIQVNGTDDIVRWCSETLANPDDARARGKRGRDEILKNVGSARKNADLLIELLKGRGGHQALQKRS
jgi:3-deoxy-D-manno-octulosonic-acid transferase